MSRSNSRKTISAPESLVLRFLRETMAAAADVTAGRVSIEKLGELTSGARYCEIRENVDSFFDSLKPYRQFGDFQTLASLPRPRPLHLHVEPHIFYGHFRAWLRKQGFDPDRGKLYSYEMRLADAERERALRIVRRVDARRGGRGKISSRRPEKQQ